MSGQRQSQFRTAKGQARAIDQVFQAPHRNDSDPKLLAYQYLQMPPQGPGNTFRVIPSEVTSALQGVSRAFTDVLPEVPATSPATADDAARAADDANRAAEVAAEAVADAETAGRVSMAA